MKTKTVEQALQIINDCLSSGNAVMHGFRSGGGLRVFRIERTKTLKRERGSLLFYGEGVDCDDALRILADDIKAGKTRPYNEVYGKEEPHYLTGTTAVCSDLDRQIIQGRSIDVWVTEKDKFVAVIKGLEDVQTSEECCNRAKISKTGSYQWTSDRGFVYETSTSQFPNGEPAFSTRIVHVPPGRTHHQGWMYDVKYQGKGDTVAEAINACLAAPPVEIVPDTMQIGDLNAH